MIVMRIVRKVHVDCVASADFLNVAVGGTYGYQCVLNGQRDKAGRTEYPD